MSQSEHSEKVAGSSLSVTGQGEYGQFCRPYNVHFPYLTCNTVCVIYMQWTATIPRYAQTDLCKGVSGLNAN